MKILHTADWHLADRLGRLDRTDDLRKGVERIADICQQEQVDVLLVAGDLFSDLARPQALKDAVEHLVETFGRFLRNGGTVVSFTGNHDRDVFCETLKLAFKLAVPEETKAGAMLPRGRFYLHTGPTYFRLASPAGHAVQFVSLPYPTGERYLKGERQKFQNIEERRRNLSDAVQQQLDRIRQHLDSQIPSVLGGHFSVEGALVRGLFRITEQQDMTFQPNALSGGFDYVALGHIHQPQAISKQEHVRYSGSIDRLDLGEREDDKSITLLEIGPQGLMGDPKQIPLDATPLYHLRLTELDEASLISLSQKYPESARALVKLEVVYRPGEHNLPAIYARLNEMFPRWYDRVPVIAGSEDGTIGPAEWLPESVLSTTPADVMRNYLNQELKDEDPDRGELLTLMEELLEEAP